MGGDEKAWVWEVDILTLNFAHCRRETMERQSSWGPLIILESFLEILMWSWGVQYSWIMVRKNCVVWHFATPWTAACRLPYPLPCPIVCSNSCPLSQWCHPTISSSVIPFSSCLQSFSASGSVPVSQFFTSGGQSIKASALASVLPMNIQDWFPLGWTSLISLQPKGFSVVFSNTKFLKHQFFGTQPRIKLIVTILIQFH